jgi:hypothetical protein
MQRFSTDEAAPYFFCAPSTISKRDDYAASRAVTENR